MFFPDSLGSEFLRITKPYWEATDTDDASRMRNVWCILTWLQGAIISRTLRERIGDKIFAGPFRGMQLIPEIMDKHFAPTLLGSYEWEIHGAVEEAITRKYKQIVNIGCSFGYYAVGFALRMPETKVFAFDIDPVAREHCKKMAQANHVEDRVIIGEAFKHEDYERFSGPETLVFMDIEGAEQDLLNPQKAPALLGMDVVVEIHDFMIPGLSTKLPLRFAETHQVRVIPNAPFNFPLEKVLGPDYIPDHFDGLIATWDGRVGPTPFGIFNRKKREQK